MGPEGSVPQPAAHPGHRAYLGEYYAPVSGQRSVAERFVDPVSNFKPPSSAQRHIFPTPYAGIWSAAVPNCLSPQPRVGPCSVYSPELDQLIIAYGSTLTGTFFNDAWSLSFADLKWRCINRSLLPPRTGCRSVLIGNLMYIFGGSKDGEFFGDLHCLDINSGQLIPINTVGPAPSPRIMPVFAVCNQSLIVWGGFNGQNPADLSILNLETFTWTSFEPNVSGRPSPSYFSYGSDVYIFGSTRAQGLTILHSELNPPDFEPIDALGEEPSISTLNSSMLGVGQFLITFGGTGNNSFTHVYAFDRERNFWFIFFVKPDDDSLSMSDGEITDQGLFVLPREHSFAACYRPNSRQIVSVCGSNERDPPPVYTISIGEALGILHHQSDMLRMINI